MIEPIGHVTAKDFAKMMSLADQVGFRESERPHVRLSRAAVLTKDQRVR